MKLYLTDRWWIPRVSKLIRKLRKKCKNCALIDAQCFQTPEAGIPSFRMQGKKPFDVIGVDQAGPLNVLDAKTMMDKPSILILACPTFRTVILQPVKNQKAEEFFRAYDIFRFDRNITPQLIISDNAQAFKTSKTVDAIQSIIYPSAWEFNPPKSAWWGGFYERLIGMVKNKLARTFNRQKFETYEDFAVAVKFLQMVVNNRPIYTSKGDRDKYVTITPSQFLKPGDPKNCERILANTLAPLTIDFHPEEIAAQFKHQQKFLQRLYTSFQCSRGYIEMVEQMQQPAKVPANVE